MSRWILSLLLVSFLSSSSMASALRQPPVLPRQWVVTATGVAQAIVVEQTDSSKIVTGPTRAISLTNDGAAGSPDIWVGFGGVTAASPVNGGNVLTIKAGETRALDCELTQISYMAASATNTLRVVTIY